ncbi:helix-turn-helix transcriptional regulator [Microbacterium caowuchunii]|uniref:Helix-turn-helix domain-containing protein n=1 Tax=Microbacterium caowuchunii TaxID=2614638 RepID=A0A5N0TKC0_9MICO|nr:helix-turn-helix domain-containing protein [Microbacterium caowuchunii]KAA9134834.1 helix-turn-helix domain-containing protein [Microbacterium caowuchunii]
MTHDGSQFDDLPALMSPLTLAKVLDVSTKTLERWRIAGTGPAFFQPEGSRLVRYGRDEVVAWLGPTRVKNGN